jgi:hypothetical protein
MGNRTRLSVRLLWVTGTISAFLLLAAGWLVYLNFHDLGKTRASGEGKSQGGAVLNTGDIITEFTWEKDNPLLATLGPDAIASSPDAHTFPGGRASTQGLSAGPDGKDINLELSGNELFDLEGIDISIDFRRNEPAGSFFSRGNHFNFGLENGFLTVHYRVDNKKGGFITVKERTGYEVPRDEAFRTYRFIYTPTSGRGEIFVNGMPVWSHSGIPNTAMYWKGAGNIFIGKGINGGGRDVAILDNLVIRSTGTLSPLAESLLSFTLEGKESGIMVRWLTAANEQANYFTVERSVNGIDFTKVGTVSANPKTGPEAEYQYLDKTPVGEGVAYYRLRQTFRNGKFVTHALSAIKLKATRELTIDRVSPVPFQESFDISYFLPNSGRVWLQLTDPNGKIVSTETFEAPQGKNIHNYQDKHGLSSGPYTVHLIFNNRKVSASIRKI